ncbi:hypothetical protein Q8G46_28405, partial [Klebsiella pneumoniae]|uniref:hypothetical protein n=1 Tax=Klebsiella pneumoniae TaxID=573 RepID=UPI0030140F69
SCNLESLEVVQTYDTEKAASNDDKPGGLASCSDEQEEESAVPEYNEDVDMSSDLQEAVLEAVILPTMRGRS